jgi:hypothetical protein
MTKDLWEVGTNDERWVGCVECVFGWLKDLDITDFEFGKNYSNDTLGIYVSEDVFHQLTEDTEKFCLGCQAPLF